METQFDKEWSEEFVVYLNTCTKERLKLLHDWFKSRKHEISTDEQDWVISHLMYKINNKMKEI